MYGTLLNLVNYGFDKKHNGSNLVVCFKEHKIKNISKKKISIVLNELNNYGYLSNRNVKLILKKKNENIQWLSSRLLFLKSLRFFESKNNIKSSISHKPNVSIVVTTNSNKVRNIGIDIEPINSLKNENSLKFFCHPQDFSFKNILELWVYKEAAYKSFMNNKNLHLNQISIRKVYGKEYFIAKTKYETSNVFSLKINNKYCSAIAVYTNAN